MTVIGPIPIRQTAVGSDLRNTRQSPQRGGYQTLTVERWRQDYNQVRPHSAHGGLTPEAVHRRSAGDRLRNPDQLRRSPATIQPAEAV